MNICRMLLKRDNHNIVRGETVLVFLVAGACWTGENFESEKEFT